MTQSVDQILDALGHHTRRDILGILKGGPLPVGVIASHFSISRPGISKHLRILQEAGLVGYTEDGTRNIFSITPTGFQELKGYLEQFWDEALSNFQKAVEG
jgi:DNA-binding transcriptional ArsR family regulator